MGQLYSDIVCLGHKEMQFNAILFTFMLIFFSIKISSHLEFTLSIFIWYWTHSWKWRGGGGLVTSINVNIFLTIVIFIFPKLYPICYFRSSGTFFQKHPSDFILYNRTCGMHENIDIYLVNFIFLWSWGTAVCASDTQFPHFSHTILSCFFVNFILVRNTLLPI